MTRITQAATPADVAVARVLFEEYAATIGGHLCFQSFQRELVELPTMYGPPDGSLLLATVDGEPAGCVAIRRMEEGVCEMKRLYVRPAYRGTGLGRLLAEAAMESGRRLGYGTMRLDTLTTMTSAQALYRRLGFRERAPRTESGAEQAIHMDASLSPAPVSA